MAAEDPAQTLYDVAATQGGYFSRLQAEAAGYSRPSLTYHTREGHFARVRHGIYRLVRFPPSEHEELCIYWLWSRQEGVYSSETALSLHGLSDILSGVLHLTLPNRWRARRVQVPEGLRLHYGDLDDTEWTWFKNVPITTVERTLHDCLAQSVSPDIIEQAFAEATTKGLIDKQTSAEFYRTL